MGVILSSVTTYTSQVTPGTTGATHLPRHSPLCQRRFGMIIIPKRRPQTGVDEPHPLDPTGIACWKSPAKPKGTTFTITAAATANALRAGIPRHRSHRDRANAAHRHRAVALARNDGYLVERRNGRSVR